MLKRIFDFLVSLLALMLLTPIFLMLMLWVKLDSPGPAFYLQERIGKEGKPFRLWKFRSMRLDSDKGNAITVGDRDPRITNSGYWIRRYKLDELPQLINVLKGDMSIVGPRPEVKKFVDLYDVEQLVVIQVRPGITDPASIEFRNENALLEGKTDPIKFYIDEIMPAKLKLNIQYIQERSFWVDIKIIFRTIYLIFRKG